MTRWVLVSIFLASTVGCRQVRDSSLRLGKDLFVTVAGPVNLPVAAVRDTYAFSDEEGWLLQGILFVPVLFVNAIKHVAVIVVHPVDAALYPFYLPVGLKPMHLYTIDKFPFTTAPYVDRFFADPLLSMDKTLSEGARKTEKSGSDQSAAEPRDFFDDP